MNFPIEQTRILLNKINVVRVNRVYEDIDCPITDDIDYNARISFLHYSLKIIARQKKQVDKELRGDSIYDSNAWKTKRMKMGKCSYCTSDAPLVTATRCKQCRIECNERSKQRRLNARG